MKRVFIVEDEAVVAMELADHLRALGYEVCGHAVRGEVALRQIPETRPDLVLMDVSLVGDLSGLDVGERLRSVMDVPVVFLTAYSDVEHTERAGRSASFAYIVKPFEPRALGANIELAIARHEAEVALRRNEARFRAIFEQAAVGVAELDTATGRFLRVNRKYCEIVGYTAEEMLGLDFMTITHPDDLAHDLAQMERLKRGELSDFLMEKRLFCKDGSIAWVDLAVSPLWEPGAAPTRHMAVVNDITERKRATASLASSEERYRRLFDGALEGIYEVEIDGTIVRVNPAFAHMLGFDSPEALVGKKTNFYVDPDARRRMQETYGPLGDTIAGVETVWRRADGAHIHVQLFGRVVRGANGEPLGYNGVIRDVTARVRAETERARLEDQLRHAQKMESLGTLAGGIAHDFNNLLAVILGSVELARTEVAPTEPVAERLDAIRVASSRATELVKQILAFSRQQPTLRSVTRVESVVEEAARLLRATLPAGIQIVLEVAGDVPLVFVDPTQIHQVLMNLGTNAWHAIGPATGNVTLRLDAVALETPPAAGLAPGRYARMQVVDNGEGMDASTLARIFEPFFTTKGVGKGTGLGLAVAHGIVAGHGGAITVESERGRGTTFSVYLPEAAEAPGPTEPVRKVARRGAGRVLLVDDEEPLVRIGTRILQRQGYEVTGFIRPADALAAVRAAPHLFDVVVTDQNMPEMGGLDLARAIAAMRPDLPIVMVSGHRVFSEEELAAANVRHHLGKPYTIDALGEIVEAALRS